MLNIGVHILGKSGLNGVAVARHGPILNHSEATGSRKVSGYLPDLQDRMFDNNIWTKKLQHIANAIIP